MLDPEDFLCQELGIGRGCRRSSVVDQQRRQPELASAETFAVKDAQVLVQPTLIAKPVVLPLVIVQVVAQLGLSLRRFPQILGAQGETVFLEAGGPRQILGRFVVMLSRDRERNRAAGVSGSPPVALTIDTHPIEEVV